MTKKFSGSTAQLVRLCLGYFLLYTVTGVLAKFFTGGPTPRLTELAYLFNNTLGGSAIALTVVLLFRWTKLKSQQYITIGAWKVPVEALYIIPSGICTAVIIPGTTLMYTMKGVSVMVAMVIMRGCIIIVSRLVDALQIRQGILTKKVYAEENWAVAFALLALGTHLLFVPVVHIIDRFGYPASKFFNLPTGNSGFDLFHGVVLVMYVLAYSVRIYIMNYFKNTRGPGAQDNKSFFAIEQIAANLTMVVLVWLTLSIASAQELPTKHLSDFIGAVHRPSPMAILSGLPYGVLAFFSVFIFMFQGRTATFVGVVNRLISLLAGVAATLLTALWLSGKMPSIQDWTSVGFMLVAVYFLTKAEKKRVVEINRSVWEQK